MEGLSHLKKLFVSNFPYQTSSDDLHTLFSEYGKVSQAIAVTDRETGNPRGFGFVSFLRDDDAATALQQLSGFEFKGRKLNVQAAEDRRPAHTGPLAQEPREDRRFRDRPRRQAEE